MNAGLREAVARLEYVSRDEEIPAGLAIGAKLSEDVAAVLAALSSPPADDVREVLIGGIARDEQDWRFGDFEETSNHSPSLAEYIADGILANPLFDVRPNGTATDRSADEPRVLSIVAEIVSERGRQDAKWGAPHDVPDGTGPAKRMLGHTFADLRDRVQAWVDEAARERTSTMSTVLLEEVFEALAESDEQKLRAELIQVAAVAAKWVQIIDARGVADVPGFEGTRDGLNGLSIRGGESS